MSNHQTCFYSLTWILTSFILLTGCRVVQGLGVESDINPTLIPLDQDDLPSEIVNVPSGHIRQWAVEAEASSEFANPEWAAIQAIGFPNTTRCGDYQTAWATAGSDAEGEWLEVRFPVAVQVSAVNIIESFNPNQVVKVELVDPFERTLEIYNKPPFQVDLTCPYTLFIPVEELNSKYDRIRITVDQSDLGLGWNQIDAVELIGLP